MPKAIQTNGDYVRSLDNVQLATLLNDNMICDLCIHNGNCDNPYNSSRCIDGVTEYLEQERPG